jgi:hypothetical protein
MKSDSVMLVAFKYAVGEAVIVKPIMTRGFIDAVMLGISGREYRCVYWIDGCRRQEWLGELELLNVEDN